MTASLNMTGTFHLPKVEDLSTELEPITVLIVDDDPAFGYLCGRVLEDDKHIKYTVVRAGDYDEAIKVFDPDVIDCALLDFNLPRFDGCQLMQYFHATYPNWFGPVVIITSGGSEEIAVDVMRAGAADYIPKQSIANSSIQRAMANALEKAKLKKAIFERNKALELANDKLARRNNEISRFYHRVSHEIKTPLTAAQMLISMLHEGLVGEISEQQRSIIGQAIESCDELTSLFNDLVECTRMDAGKLRVNRKPGQLDAMVQRAVLAVSPVADARAITIVTAVDDDLPELFVDAGRIVQVLANLLGNAIKFTQPGGRVSVCAQLAAHQSGFVEVCVTDTGMGIDAKDLPRIFDRLYQVNDVGDAVVGAGLGLGLTIASELIQLHGGNITVKSEPGVGSAFTVVLPIGSPIISLSECTSQ